MESKVFDTLLEPTFIINQDKKTVYCNEPAALICDLTVRKILRSQQALNQLFKFSEQLVGLDQISSITEPTPYQEVKFETQSGKSGKVQITIQPITLGDLPDKNWVVFFRDVTLEETLQKKYRAELEQKEDVIKDLEKAKEELQDYSKNLEGMVAKRTAELTRLNQLMSALLDSLGQGFLVFEESGRCMEVYSKACESVLECDPKNKFIWEVFKLPQTQIVGFKRWIQTIFGEMLPFEDLAPLGPQNFAHSEQKSIQLAYYPLRTNDGSLGGVVVVATDVTNLIEAKKEAEFERAHAKMILSLIRHKKQVAGFLREAEIILKDIKNEFSKSEIDPEATFRFLHTLKGGAASFSIKSISDQCHMGESILSQYRINHSPETLTSLNQTCMELVPKFYHFLEENKDILGNVDKMRERWVETPISQVVEFYKNPELQKIPTLRSLFTESFIMEPIESFFSHYNEVIQTVAEREGKSIGPLEITNGSLKIIPEPYDTLFSTFVHAFRNAVDHGIEVSSSRIESGKPANGKIQITFELTRTAASKNLLITITDDGAGIQPSKIRSVLQKKGLDVSHEADEQVIQHIFDSQLSTKEQVTETSGRGIGMDAILTAAQNLGGRAWVKSEAGKGSVISIEVPYFDSWIQTSLQLAKIAS